MREAVSTISWLELVTGIDHDTATHRPRTHEAAINRGYVTHEATIDQEIAAHEAEMRGILITRRYSEYHSLPTPTISTAGMGVQSMVKAALSNFKSINLPTPRLFAKVCGRFSRVAATVDASGDPSQQKKLEDVTQIIARQLIEVGAGSGDVSDQLTPHIYERVKAILSDADRMLDAFQPAPEDHMKDIEKAKSQDERAYGTLLKELGQADDTTLKYAHDLGKSSPKPLPTPKSLGGSNQMRRESTLPVIQEQVAERQQSHASTSGISEVSTKEEMAHAQFSKTLEQHKEGKRSPSAIIGTSVLGSESVDITTLIFPMDQTFAGLAGTFMDFDSYLPDFWSKDIDPTQNPVTPSGMFFQWQDPSNKVMDAITKTGHLGIETVCKNVEYIVALVKKGEKENGMPIDIPRVRPLPTSEHFQNLFPDRTISQICRLEASASNASEVLFDSRAFRHHTTPLVVEFSAE